MISSATLRSQVSDSLQKCYILPISSRCNARCTFCATKEYRPAIKKQVMPVTGLAEVIGALIQAGSSRFEVTGGGEPTLHSQLADIIALVRERGASMIKLYTNGLRLGAGLDIDQLNISRASFNESTNNSIMRFVGGTLTFEEIVQRARGWGYREIRASVPLIKGAVDSPCKAQEFVHAVKGLVDGVVFRPLYPATPQRDAIVPTLAASEWLDTITRLNSDLAGEIQVEFDSDGCFRSKQTILASDLGVYGDWSLSNRIYP